MAPAYTPSSARRSEWNSADPSDEPSTVIECDSKIEEQLAPLFRVICHDDPVTTMDFVVEVLRSVFKLPHGRSVEVMYRVHHTGAAVVGRYPESVAHRRVERAKGLARSKDFPLTLTIERDD